MSIRNPERNLVIATGAVDDLGEGAAGHAVQKAGTLCVR